MLSINSSKLFEVISSEVRRIDEELREYDKGVFFVPELHLAFEIGKALYRSREEVFGAAAIEWLREINLGNGGPSDLIFRSGEELVVFEFKIGSTSHAYRKDIEKLQKLSTIDSFKGYTYFVALIDRFPDKGDSRIDYLESLNGSHLLIDSFNVNYKTYKGSIDCILALYEVVSPIA